jgi:hypothetical protein
MRLLSQIQGIDGYRRPGSQLVLFFRSRARAPGHREKGDVKLSDPFGRVSRRDQQRYLSLEQRLREQGVCDDAALRQFTRRMTRTMALLVTGILAVAAALALAFPASRGLVSLLGVLVFVWLAAGYAQTRLYLKRYRREQLGGP